jgi:hypothetical protein
LNPSAAVADADAQRASASPTWCQCTRLTLLISAASMSKCAMCAPSARTPPDAGDAVVEARADAIR